MAATTWFSIPYDRQLSTREGWKRDAKNKNRYYTVRFHYVLRQRQLNQPVQYGEVVDAFTSAPGVTQTTVRSVEFERQTVKLEESVRESLRQEELSEELSTSVLAALGPQFLVTLSAEVKAQAQERLLRSFRRTFTDQLAVTTITREKISHEFTINPDKFRSDATVVLSMGYKRHCCDLYLVFFDYLVVEYAKRFLVGKFRRTKYPPPSNPPHPNIVKLDLPLVSMEFWRPLERTVLALDQSRHKVQVEDPLEVQIKELDKPRAFSPRLPHRPSLYKLSNKAFPLKLS